MRPKMSGVVLPCSYAGEAEWLAGIPAADEVNGFNVAPVDCCDVAKVGNIGPVLREYPAGVRIDFALPGHGHSGTFQAKVKTADSREEAADFHSPPSAIGALPDSAASIIERLEV